MTTSRTNSKVRWLLAVGLLVTASVSAAWWVRPHGPDLVIVVLDTLRPDHLGCYGYDRDTSPHLDAFAAESVVFDRAESVSPWTAPAMISLMTSLHPEVHGVFRFPNPGRLNERVTTLAEVLSARGYATGAFTEGGYAKPEFGLDQGFDVFPPNEGDDDSHMSNVDHPSRIEGNVDRALEWLAAQGSRPVFMLFHTYEVHAPLRAPDEYVRAYRPNWDTEEEERLLAEALERYRTSRMIDPEDVLRMFNHRHHCEPDWPPRLQMFLSENGLNPEGNALNAETLGFVRDQYDAEIRFMDDQLRRLFDALDEDAIVVVVSDHGESLGERGVFGHGRALHEELLRVALMIRAPGVAPRRVGELVRSIDVLPTVLELLKATPDDLTVQGSSLVPLMRGESGPARTSFSHGLTLTGYEDSERSLRTGKWRAIVDGKSGSVRLYDVEGDPLELADVSSGNEEVAARLAERVRAQRTADAGLKRLVSGDVEQSDLDAEMIEELRKLGYID